MFSMFAILRRFYTWFLRCHFEAGTLQCIFNDFHMFNIKNKVTIFVLLQMLGGQREGAGCWCRWCWGCVVCDGAGCVSLGAVKMRVHHVGQRM